jgi:hypothetical protein
MNRDTIGSSVDTFIFFVSLIGVTMGTLLLAGFTGWQEQRQASHVAQAAVLVERFKSATSPDERLTSLAELFKLPGQGEQARRLFFEELSSADQRALFDPADPQGVAEQLVSVVRGVYTHPALVNHEQSNALLTKMAQAVSQLYTLPSLGSNELNIEITMWLKGRAYYRNHQYQQAVYAYEVAIGTHDQNPGTYFDRGLAFAALGETDDALADFAAVLSLDASWQEQVKQTLTSDAQLYADVGGKPRQYRELIALVPTPTSTPTPIPTATREPSASAPTLTPTPLPSPTSPVPTRITLIPTPTPKPLTMSGAPSGGLTLLGPSLLDRSPSYGPTSFEWKWDGVVPPDLGFEVRVWREGEPPAGIHDALLDNRAGRIEKSGENTYRLKINIEDILEPTGSRPRPTGEYLWTVGFVRIEPEYADLGEGYWAASARFRFEAGVADSGDGGAGGGGID